MAIDDDLNAASCTEGTAMITYLWMARRLGAFGAP